MKEIKQAPATPEARAAMHEMMAAFEAFKGANDARLDEIERKASADSLLEEKVARIDQAVAGAQARLDRIVSEGRRPELAPGGGSAVQPEVKAAFDGYMRAGAMLEVKAGLSTAPTSGGYVVPEQTERAIERRLMAGSPMREIATVRTVAAGVFRKPVSIAGVGSGWVAETAARPQTDPATLALLEFPSADLYACPAATGDSLSRSLSRAAADGEVSLVVVLEAQMPRVELAGGERGLPLIWRAAPAGAPAGGAGVSEVAWTATGVHGSPWSPAHLKLKARAEGGLNLSWIARSRIDGDRWDGEAVSADPMRFRVRVLDGEAVVRTWEVDGVSAVYPADERTADFPDGVPEGVRLAVAQRGEGYGWGAEASIALI